MKDFDIFTSFSRLKPSKSKCEVTRTDAVKGSRYVLLYMKCIDLR